MQEIQKEVELQEGRKYYQKY